MACSCQKKSKFAKAVWVVSLPGGKQKSYSSEVAARAEAARHPGAYVAGPQEGSA